MAPAGNRPEESGAQAGTGTVETAVLRAATRALGSQTMACLNAYLATNPDQLAHASAVFLEKLGRLWQLEEVESAEVFQELTARVELSHQLFARGIRARKGEGYRSTKLP
ncbi:hypothetical protein [Oecophyllibacter saccharovorans]|uniref:Uncharacterized protein n=1 Tax=Oecophyllibacter saccharovorans TaxID=2558360 RepID=A0A506ULU0_9PROT|nr:hypothetical protein [Oecophyllibacter saccharovorans]TPW34311.1 hypothetical protein E3202_07395 [Oecophyllibacter saccharovorans]TPW36498.1 hypothetical protein E3203_01625 [Oecophyllibacter saccharovorans]